MYTDYCGENCQYLNISEKDQNLYSRKPDHRCHKYNVRLYHLRFHPNIVKCRACKEQK